MKRPDNYRTKQRQALLAYLTSRAGMHVTAAQILEHFNTDAVPVGRTTVYRLLDKLAANGTIRKYTIDGITGACYQYIENGSACEEHLHLKCENCGELLHLQCETMKDMRRHIQDEHAFKIDTTKTVLYGKCDACL